jgi:putative ABC transport system permease protein
MLTNLIKLTFRHFIRYSGYSLTNIFGLAVGLATCIVIFLFVQDELSYDRQFSSAENIYRLEPHWVGQGEDSRWAATEGFLLPEIMKSYPEIVSGVKITIPYNSYIFSYENRLFNEKNVLIADSLFLDVFDYRVISGNPSKMLTGTGKIVLTESTARRYFADDEPMGKILALSDKSYTVAGIIADPPKNSHLSFDMLIPLDDLRSKWPGADKPGPSVFYTYIKVADKASAQEVERKFNEHIYTHFGMVVGDDSTNMPKDYTGQLIFQPLTKIHLYGDAEKELSTNSDVRYVTIFSAVAIFVLFIACFNYMNLATAKSARRSREVGLRKVLGATRADVFYQFMGESFSFAVISMFLAFFIVELALPEFNQFMGKNLNLNFFSNFPLIVLIVITVLTVGILSGTYPALFMSKFNPVEALKSNAFAKGANKKSLYLRRGLVVAQFSISIFLIIGVLSVNRQLNFIQKKNLGFDKNQVLVIQLSDKSAFEKLEVLKNELLQNTGVISAAGSSDIPGKRVPFLAVRLPGEEKKVNTKTENDEDQPMSMRTWSAGFDLVKTLGLEIAEGRDFSKESGTDPDAAFLLNEAAVRELEIKNPVGHDFEYVYNVKVPKSGKIIGVVKDFNYASLHSKVEPLMIHLYPPYFRYLLVKIKSGNTRETLSEIDQLWTRHIPGIPLDYFFLDSAYDDLYRTEMNTGSILGLFTILAMIIAGLGLFGLASFITEQRTREIGIRRVLGASVVQIISKLTREFVILVAIANVIAWIPAYYFIDNWLNSFAYRSSVSPWIFIVSTVLSLLLAFLTVSTKAFATARVNPVTSLKYE